MLTETDHLLQCLKLIEQKLGWGNSENWKSRDFDQLSELIFQQTQVLISVSTLKRIWGKIKYNSFPNPSTVDALAQFAGFENWRHLKNKLSEKEEVVIVDEPATLPAKRKKVSRAVWMVPAAFLVICLFAFFLLKDGRKNWGKAKTFTFKSQPLAVGLPNSVVFDYDVSAADADSVFIQQSWDPSKKVKVAKDKHQYTSIYYFPGFFRAKLIADTTILKEHDLLVPTNGWLGVVDQKNVPAYFTEDEITGSNKLYLPAEKMSERNITLQPETPKTFYFNIGCVKEAVYNDNFSFETELKPEFSSGTAVCQTMSIKILSENDAILVPFSIPGCVANIKLHIAGVNVKGSEANLSAFGVNTKAFTRLRVEGKDKHIRIYINDTLAYETTFPNKPTKIIGFGYHFEGTGSVNYLVLKDGKGKEVYGDRFGK